GTLEAISQNIQTILKHQFALSHTPDPGTVAVSVNGAPMTSGWGVAGNVITFSQVPPEGAAISVSYAYGGSPIVKSFALTQPASADGIQVKVNDVTVSPSSYSFDAPANAIVFNQYPAENASILVNFKEKVTWLKSFAIGATAVAS